MSGSITAQVSVFVDRNLTPQALSKRFAEAARTYRDEQIARGRASLFYETFVDGRRGAAEETVRPGGLILYRFNPLPEAIAFAVAFLVNRSPIESGTYARSWIVVVDGREYRGDVRRIPRAAEVFITNRQPYHRKIDTGAQGEAAKGRAFARPGRATKIKRGAYVSIIEAARREVRASYPSIDTGRVFLTIPNGYVLKGRRRRAKLDMRSAAYRRGQRYLMVRGDRTRGNPMTYPALVLWVRR